MHTIKWKYENAIFTLGKENLSAEDCLKVFEKPVTSLSWKKSYWTNTSRIDYLRITQAITSSQTTPAPMSQKVKRDMLYSEAFKQSPKNFISMFVIILLLMGNSQATFYISTWELAWTRDQSLQPPGLQGWECNCYNFEVERVVSKLSRRNSEFKSFLMNSFKAGDYRAANFATSKQVRFYLDISIISRKWRWMCVVNADISSQLATMCHFIL